MKLYRNVDENGSVSYDEKPDEPGTEFVEVSYVPEFLEAGSIVYSTEEVTDGETRQLQNGQYQNYEYGENDE